MLVMHHLFRWSEMAARLERPPRLVRPVLRAVVMLHVSRAPLVTTLPLELGLALPALRVRALHAPLAFILLLVWRLVLCAVRAPSLPKDLSRAPLVLHAPTPPTRRPSVPTARLDSTRQVTRQRPLALLVMLVTTRLEAREPV